MDHGGKFLNQFVISLKSGSITARSAVTPADVVSIDIATTTGSILETIGNLDLALNLGDSASAPINGGS